MSQYDQQIIEEIQELYYRQNVGKGLLNKTYDPLVVEQALGSQRDKKNRRHVKKG